MGDFVKTGCAAFDNAGAAKVIGAAAAWTAGTWIEGSPRQGLVVVSLTLSGRVATKIEAKIDLGVGDIASPTVRGPVPQINSVTGGETDWDDSIQVLPLDAGPHVFELPLRSNYHWRLSLRHTGGDGTTAGLALADVIA
jgi:hypothetical protein